MVQYAQRYELYSVERDDKEEYEDEGEYYKAVKDLFEILGLEIYLSLQWGALAILLWDEDYV